jgi:mannose-1-phosphate guanylyltransferase/mannose-6-phosphate isomerase
MIERRNIIPVVLCGGKGSRLWPLSSPKVPKHFLNFGNPKTLFQQTLLRCAGGNFDPKPIIVSNSSYRETVQSQLREIGLYADLCLEFEGRNSCPAIVFACLMALERTNDPTLLILPSDHLIEPVDMFHEIVTDAASISATHLVTFGISPDSPQTGYGYIQAGSMLCHEGENPIFQVKRFVEKPDENTARKYCEEGYLWNAGVFLLNARLYLKEMARYQSGLLDLAKQAFQLGIRCESVLEIDPVTTKNMPSLSVDNGVFEFSDNVAVCPAQINWRDIGNWDRAAVLYPQDRYKNSVEGNAEFCESTDNFVHAPYHKTCLVGVDNLAVIVTQDAVLVTDRARCEKIGILAAQFKKPEIQVGMYNDVDRRPWGEFHRIDLGEGYQVKRLKVDPGQSLSLQSHRFRAEHWIVVSGEAEVTIGDKSKLCQVDESVYIPKGSVHRLANKTKEPLILIEVQTGNYFGEDDIVRLEDDYDRLKK